MNAFNKQIIQQYGENGERGPTVPVIAPPTTLRGRDHASSLFHVEQPRPTTSLVKDLVVIVSLCVSNVIFYKWNIFFERCTGSFRCFFFQIDFLYCRDNVKQTNKIIINNLVLKMAFIQNCKPRLFIEPQIDIWWVGSRKSRCQGRKNHDNVRSKA